MAASDITLAYWHEHREQFRQSERQRATLTNVILIVVAALTAFIAQQEVSPDTTPAALLIVGFAAFGVVASAKYHERATYHLHQARALTSELMRAGDLRDHRGPLHDARTAHYARYPVMRRLRLHWVWNGIHISLMGYGSVLVVLTRLS